MPACVLDASTAVAWAMPDEIAPPAHLWDMISLDGAIVPPLWPFEVANTVLNAVRRGRVTETAMVQILTELSAMNAHIEDESAIACWGSTATIALTYRLSVYDAAYLELAKRRNLPLATLDRRLAEAAQAAGVALL